MQNCWILLMICIPLEKEMDRTFLQCLAANHEQVIDYPRNNDQLIKAQNNANIKKEAQLISIQDTPTREAVFKELALMRREKIQHNKV